MNQARSGLGVAVVNDKIYAIGGSTENGTTPNSEGNDYKALGWITATNEEYDTATDMWTVRESMPTPRCNFGIAVYQNKIYCIGGIINWVSGQTIVTDVNEVYDPATDTWETKTSMPTAASAQANTVGDKIYLIGGSPNGTLNQVYDPATDSWTNKEPMPVAIGMHNIPNTISSTIVSTVVDDEIYMMSFAVALSPTWTGMVEIYNPVNDSWNVRERSLAALLEGGNWWSQAACSTTGDSAVKQIYIFFARYPSSTILPNIAYNPFVDVWTVATSVPTYRQNVGVAVVNDVFYVIGGHSFSYPFPGDSYFIVTQEAVNEQYTPLRYEDVPPSVDVVSPENNTYYVTDVSVVFMVDKQAVWMGYSLDGQDNVTVTENMINLTDLTDGLHTITVYATDLAGNIGASETIIFSINKKSDPTTITLTATVTAIAIAATVIILIAYIKKGRKTTTK